MKKAITLFLVSICVYTLCACSGGTSKKIKTEADAVGTYKSVGLFFEEEYHLNENTTFDIINAKSSNGHNGTYSVTSENNISLKPSDSVKLEINIKDNLYYITGFMDCFEKDEKYGLKPTFDENGRSNQTFKQLYGDNNYSYEIGLSLSDDGTYSANYQKIKNISGMSFNDFLKNRDILYEIDNTYEGTYRFENDVLWLNFKEKDYPMFLIDESLYFDIIEKAE